MSTCGRSYNGNFSFKKWYPWGDSNARTRFRKPLLYPPELQGHELGGDRGIRTPDLCDANAALSQLSYIPSSPNYSTYEAFY